MTSIVTKGMVPMTALTVKMPWPLYEKKIGVALQHWLKLELHALLKIKVIFFVLYPLLFRWSCCGDEQ